MATLHIDAELLKQAEQQAKRHNINLNQAVEAFIRRFISHPVKEQSKIKVTPFVERLGVELDLPEGFNEKDEYRKHLEEKYQ